MLTTESTTTPMTESQLPKEITFRGHSPLLYWWPVWAVGYVMAAWTAMGDYHLAFLPAGATVEGNVLTIPEGSQPLLSNVHATRSGVPGAIFVFTIFMVLAFRTGLIGGRNVLRIAAGVVLFLALITCVYGWNRLTNAATYLGIHFNLGAYIVLSSVLLVTWLNQVFIMDRHNYVTVSANGVHFREASDTQEQTSSTAGVSLVEEPYDWFRWLIGGEAGTVRIHVADRLIELANVTYSTRRMKVANALIGQGLSA